MVPFNSAVPVASLRKITRTLHDSISRVATGLKVMGGGDAGSQSLANTLNARAASFQAAETNTDSGISLLQLAESALLELNNLATRLKEIGVADTLSTNTTSDTAALNSEAVYVSDTIDSIVLYHALDFTNDCHELLREVTRVLRPGGNMLIIGFNPVSAWGLWRLFKRKRSPPWKGRFLSVARLSDWLRLLDLQVISTERAVHFPPLSSRRILNFADTFEKIGKKMKSPFGGSYYIQCVKQVVPITPIVTLSRLNKIRSASASIPITENINIKITE